MSDPVLIKRQGRKKVSNYMCRKGSHEWVDLGGFGQEGDEYTFSWCSTCGCLKEEHATGVKTTKIIRTPDMGI